MTVRTVLVVLGSVLLIGCATHSEPREEYQGDGLGRGPNNERWRTDRDEDRRRGQQTDSSASGQQTDSSASGPRPSPPVDRAN